MFVSSQWSWGTFIVVEVENYKKEIFELCINVMCWGASPYKIENSRFMKACCLVWTKKAKVTCEKKLSANKKQNKILDRSW